VFFENKLSYLQNTYAVKRDLIEARLDKIEILATGSSHSVAINPRFFSRPGFNLANVSQDIFYDTQLINLYQSQLKNLKLVIIPISYFSLEYQLDQSVEAWRMFFYNRFLGLPFETEPSLLEMRRYSLFAMYGINQSLQWAWQGAKIELAEPIDENGWQPQPNQTNKTQVITDRQAKIRVASHEALMNPAILQTNMASISMTVEKLSRQNIQVVFLTTPVFQIYSDNIDSVKYNRMQGAIRQLSDTYHIRYFNYLSDPRFALEDFNDNDHLNAQGAEKFSRIIDREIIRMVLGSSF